MNKNLFIAILSSGLLLTLSGCAAPDHRTPSLRGNTQYTSALPAPSPNRAQANSAIEASTMIAPR